MLRPGGGVMWLNVAHVALARQGAHPLRRVSGGQARRCARYSILRRTEGARNGTRHCSTKNRLVEQGASSQLRAKGRFAHSTALGAQKGCRSASFHLFLALRGSPRPGPAHQLPKSIHAGSAGEGCSRVGAGNVHHRKGVCACVCCVCVCVCLFVCLFVFFLRVCVCVCLSLSVRICCACQTCFDAARGIESDCSILAPLTFSDSLPWRFGGSFCAAP